MIKELVKSARSYRAFDESVKVDRDTLLDLVDTARLTSSGRNLQPLKYRLIYTAEECATLLPLTAWAAALRDIKLPPEGKAPTAYIIICHDKNILPALEQSEKDVGIVSEAIILAAAEKELGGCMIANFGAAKVAEAFSLSDNLVPKLIIALGKPDESVVITEIADGENTSYYRENGIHYVPKRKLEDIVI